MTTNLKTKKFTIYVKAVLEYTSIIQAESLKQALEKAESLTETELHKLPGDILDSEHTITGVTG